jgi:hypothetical protein
MNSDVAISGFESAIHPHPHQQQPSDLGSSTEPVDHQIGSVASATLPTTTLTRITVLLLQSPTPPTTLIVGQTTSSSPRNAMPQIDQCWMDGLKISSANWIANFFNRGSWCLPLKTFVVPIHMILCFYYTYHLKALDDDLRGYGIFSSGAKVWYLRIQDCPFTKATGRINREGTLVPTNALDSSCRYTPEYIIMFMYVNHVFGIMERLERIRSSFRKRLRSTTVLLVSSSPSSVAYDSFNQQSITIF